MTRIRRYPLKGCRYLAFKYVENRHDGALDFWLVTCAKEGVCGHRDREGGPTKTCFSDPYTTYIEEKKGLKLKDIGREIGVI